MTIDENPYAPPQADCQAEAPPNAIGVWRQGDLLVMSRDAVLPLRCVITGEPAHQYWPWPISNWSFGRATIQAPLSWRVALKNFLYGALAGLLFIGGMACLLGGAILMRSGRTIGGWLFVAGVPLIVAGMACAWFAIPLLVLERDSDTHLWISGVHPDYLADLPEWPYTER